jgi:hypothetical protein
MTKTNQKIGFSYFTSPEFLVRKRVETWFPILRQLGGSLVVLESGFDRAIPEDVFQSAKNHSLEPIIHFTFELPLARKFNELSVLLDAYNKWGVKTVILGDKPNCKDAWPTAGWHYDNLVDHFLDRFIPLANYIAQIGMTPVLPPLQPGGDYWDTAFVELVLRGLKRRRLTSLLEKLNLSSYGYTFNRPLSWGAGGPERWSSSRPYLTPDGQQDQLGFQNFEWHQAMALRVTGKQIPVLILDAGAPGDEKLLQNQDRAIESIQLILQACRGKENGEIASEDEYPVFNGSVLGCTFSMDSLLELMKDDLSIEVLHGIFKPEESEQAKNILTNTSLKQIEHYLLLPTHESGVSDVVLNKVRPIIKILRPTIGFSLEEAMSARKVSVFPDSVVFTDEKINRLRTAGCIVDILPQSGIEIATSLQGS